MNGWEIALLVVVCVAFLAAVGIIVRNKIKGKSCCGDCDGCSGCAAKNKSRAACPHCSHCDGGCGEEKTENKQE